MPTTSVRKGRDGHKPRLATTPRPGYGLTVSQVAERLQTTEKVVRDLIKRGLLPAVNLRPGSLRGSWRVSEQALEAYLTKALSQEENPND